MICVELDLCLYFVLHLQRNENDACVSVYILAANIVAAHISTNFDSWNKIAAQRIHIHTAYLFISQNSIEIRTQNIYYYI